MGKFLTAHSRFEQLNIPEKWKLIDNQLYKDDDGIIYLCPRNYITDGYTIPSWLTIVGGSKMKYDTRASSQHDYECSYHKCIITNIDEDKLRSMGFLRTSNGINVCDNIPLEFLTIKKTSFIETNKRFMRMLKSVNNIPKWRAKMMYQAVNLNMSWLWTQNELDENKIYEVDYGLLK